MDSKQVVTQKNDVAAPADQLRPSRQVTPLVDIYETADELVLLADLPGADERDLQLEVEQGVLTLEAQITAEQGTTKSSYYRQFKLSERIDSAAGEAVLKDGVLTLKLPKVAAAKPKKITVKTLH